MLCDRFLAGAPGAAVVTSEASSIRSPTAHSIRIQIPKERDRLAACS